MKNTHIGTRERILHATSIDEAVTVYGSLTAIGARFPAKYVTRCAQALVRAKDRLSKYKPKPAPTPEVSEVKEWSPGSEAPRPKVTNDPLFNKRGKKK